jgi:hypothetical protein
MRRIPAWTRGRAGRAAVIAAAALTLPGCVAGARAPGAGATAASPPAAGAQWFRQAADIATLTPATDRQGDPTGGTPKNIGGEAAAVLDVNHDGVPDIVIVNGTSYYFVSLGHRGPDGSVSFSPARPYLVGVPGDGKRSVPKALGLTDFNGDGRLDLYLGNTGNGTLALKNPRDLADAGNPARLQTSNLPQSDRYRTYLSNGNGTFSYANLGADVNGDTRSALFADFDGDGHQDFLGLNAEYYGIWWGGSPAPPSLLPGEPGGTFGQNLLPGAIVNSKGQPETGLFQNAFGQGDVDLKGAVVRDFDGDGKPDIIATAYSDVWDGQSKPPLAAANPAGARIDLNHDGIPDGGYQGDFKHGVVVLRNISTPGHIKFEDVSNSAIDQALGFGDKMDAYAAIPLDFNNDGKMDLAVIGVRNFTAFGSLTYNTPIIQLYRNDSTPGHLTFTNVTKESGLNFMNSNAALSKATGGRYPVVIPGMMAGGSPLVLTPDLSSGAAVDLNNDGRTDLVLVDRQLESRNPLTGAEFSPFVFLNEGDGKFRMIPPSVTGLAHTARDISYGDFNGDGKMDLVTVNGSGGGQTVDDDNYVFLNQMAEANHWIGLKLAAPGNPLGLGARVTVYQAGTRRILGDDEMQTDFAYRSRRDAQLHFGLGKTSCVDVRIEGLGRPVTVRGLRADQVQTITLPRAAHALPQRGCGARAGAR